MRLQAPSQSASPTLRLTRPTRNGATASGQIDAGLVVVRLDQRRRETARADAVGTHVNAVLLAVRSVDDRLHRQRSTWSRSRKYGRPRCRAPKCAPRPAARRTPPRRASPRSPRRATSICRTRPALSPRRRSRWSRRRRLEAEIVAVAEDLAFAGRGQNDELVRQVAADRAGVGHHRNGGEAEALEGAQVGGEHPVVGMARAGLIEVERIGVLHQELARAHDAEARPDLVAELPLDVIEV